MFDPSEDATSSDIMEELYVRMKVERGLAEIERGEVLDHSQVKERLRKWVG